MDTIGNLASIFLYICFECILQAQKDKTRSVLPRCPQNTPHQLTKLTEHIKCNNVDLGLLTCVLDSRPDKTKVMPANGVFAEANARVGRFEASCVFSNCRLPHERVDQFTLENKSYNYVTNYINYKQNHQPLQMKLVETGICKLASSIALVIKIECSNQCLSGKLLCSYHLGNCNQEFVHFDRSRDLVFGGILFSISFRFLHHARAFIPRQNRPSINMIQNLMTQIITWVCNDSLTLPYPPNINI